MPLGFNHPLSLLSLSHTPELRRKPLRILLSAPIDLTAATAVIIWPPSPKGSTPQPYCHAPHSSEMPPHFSLSLSLVRTGLTPNGVCVIHSQLPTASCPLRYRILALGPPDLEPPPPPTTPLQWAPLFSHLSPILSSLTVIKKNRLHINCRFNEHSVHGALALIGSCNLRIPCIAVPSYRPNSISINWDLLRYGNMTIYVTLNL
jgi:hypothetical protein